MNKFFIGTILLLTQFAWAEDKPTLKTKKIGSTLNNPPALTSATSSSAPTPPPKHWGIGALYELAPLTGKGFDFKTMSGGYMFLDLTYSPGWRFKPYARLQMTHTFSGEDQDGKERAMFTMLDPIIGLKGNFSLTPNLVLKNNLRGFIPLSESSVDKGKLAEIRLINDFVYTVPKTSFYIDIQSTIYAYFYGYSQTTAKAEGTYGKLKLALMVGSKITDKLSWELSVESSATRKDGRSLGYLDYKAGQEAFNFQLEYQLLDKLSVTPLVGFSLESKDIVAGLDLFWSIY